jgi:hypothetical protein
LPLPGLVPVILTELMLSSLLSVDVFGSGKSLPPFLDLTSSTGRLPLANLLTHYSCFLEDICTCRPYLTYGIEEAIRCAQRGGVGLIIYYRKEGRALGEVTKCTCLRGLYSLPQTMRSLADLVVLLRSRLQLSKARRGFCRSILQVYGAHCRRERYALPSSHD